MVSLMYKVLFHLVIVVLQAYSAPFHASTAVRLGSDVLFENMNNGTMRDGSNHTECGALCIMQETTCYGFILCDNKCCLLLYMPSLASVCDATSKPCFKRM